jgi:hypothetical protein
VAIKLVVTLLGDSVAGVDAAFPVDLCHTFGALAVQAFSLTDVKAYMGGEHFR